eukprot:8536001-Alexandrium_andersonii.AAC.1
MSGKSRPASGPTRLPRGASESPCPCLSAPCSECAAVNRLRPLRAPHPCPNRAPRLRPSQRASAAPEQRSAQAVASDSQGRHQSPCPGRRPR